MRQEIQFIGLTPEDLCMLISESVKAQIKEHNTPTVKQPNEEQSDLMTRSQTAEFLKVSFQTIHEWQKNGILKVYKLGNRVYFRRSEILQTLFNSNV